MVILENLLALQLTSGNQLSFVYAPHCQTHLFWPATRGYVLCLNKSWSTSFLFCNSKKVFSCSCLLRIWSPGLLAYSKCTVTSNQAILQSKLPSGRMALWLLRCIKGLLRRRWRDHFPKPALTVQGVARVQWERLCRIVSSYNYKISACRVLIVGCINSVFFFFWMLFLFT